MKLLSPAERVRLHWESVLDRLELDIDRTEALVAGHHVVALEVWEPPVSDGPIPDDLVPRARALHAVQQELTRRLAESLSEVRGQQAFTEKVGRASGPATATPRFVDVRA